MSFQYVKPTLAEAELMQVFRDAFQKLESEINSKVTPSRGVSLAITNLEQAAFWLNKAITKNDNGYRSV